MFEGHHVSDGDRGLDMQPVQSSGLNLQLDVWVAQGILDTVELPDFFWVAPKLVSNIAVPPQGVVASALCHFEISKVVHKLGQIVKICIGSSVQFAEWVGDIALKPESP